MKMDAKTTRIKIWEELLRVARPNSKFSWGFSEFIADYEDSDKGVALLAPTDTYKSAKVIFITPDNNLEKLREAALRDKKIVVITNYEITREFFLIKPESIPEGKEEVASLSDDVSRCWKHQTLRQLKEFVGHIGMLVTGVSAVTPGGIRSGRGHGYFDLEWTILYTMDIVDETSTIVDAGHNCQVANVDVTVKEHDTAINYIVTPARIIETHHKFPRPAKSIIWCRLTPGVGEQIPPVQEL